MASTDSKLTKLKFLPGFHKESTQYSEEGKWFEGNRVRFREGKPENLRGYIKHNSETINGIARDLLRLGINTVLSSFGGPFASLPTFAAGGRPPVGRPSIVGERGPELFVPSTAGTIIPNHKMGGMTNNIVVNVDVDGGTSVDADENTSKQFGLALAAAIQSEIINQKRAGGLLA